MAILYVMARHGNSIWYGKAWLGVAGRSMQNTLQYADLHNVKLCCLIVVVCVFVVAPLLFVLPLLTALYSMRSLYAASPQDTYVLYTSCRDRRGLTCIIST